MGKVVKENHIRKVRKSEERKVKQRHNSIFLVEFSGNIGRNGFLTSIASQKIFRPYFQKSRLEYYFLCLFYFSSPYSGHLRSDFVVLLLLLTARCRRTRKADQKCPEKQDKKSKRDMKNMITINNKIFYFVRGKGVLLNSQYLMLISNRNVNLMRAGYFQPNGCLSSIKKKEMHFHVSLTFLVLLFWTFLVRFSGPPTPSCQKEQENHKIGPQMSRIGTRKVKETQKIAFWS